MLHSVARVDVGRASGRPCVAACDSIRAWDPVRNPADHLRNIEEHTSARSDELTSSTCQLSCSAGRQASAAAPARLNGSSPRAPVRRPAPRSRHSPDAHIRGIAHLSGTRHSIRGEIQSDRPQLRHDRARRPRVCCRRSGGSGLLLATRSRSASSWLPCWRTAFQPLGCPGPTL